MISPLLFLKIVVPETKISTPDSIASFEFSKSIPPSKDIFELSLDDAIELLNTKQSTGRVLGKDEDSGNEIELKRGRFGFYVTDGKINASLKNGEDMEITLEQAIEKIQAKAKQYPLEKS